MKLTTTIRNNWYFVEIRKKGYAGLVDWFRVKPTDRQIRRFIADYKLANKRMDRN
jgi:hypothetical protein